MPLINMVTLSHTLVKCRLCPVCDTIAILGLGRMGKRAVAASLAVMTLTLALVSTSPRSRGLDVLT